MAAAGETAAPTASATARPVALADSIFKCRISDHLPLEFVIEKPDLLPRALRVFSWNVMARGLCRPVSAAAAGESAKQGASNPTTNNGLDLDEDISSYELRLETKVAPVIGKYLQELRREGECCCHWIVCLQEAPGHPGILESFLSSIATHSGISPTELRYADMAKTACARNITLWATADWNMHSCSESPGGHAVCTVLSKSSEFAIRLLNCHFPVDAGSSDEDGPVQISPSVSNVLEMLTTVPAGQIGLLVGDLNFDVREVNLADRIVQNLNTPDASRSVAVSCVANCALYRGNEVTSDAVVLVVGRDAHEPLPTVCEAKRIGEGWDPLGGLSRQAFIEKNIHWNLQPQLLKLRELTDRDLGSMGAHHFGDQPSILSHWLARQCSSSAGSGGTARADGVRECRRNSSMPRPIADPFKGEGREAYVQGHIHRKLQRQVASLSDEDLWLLGQVHFSEQFTELANLQKKVKSRANTHDTDSGMLKHDAGEDNQAAALRLPGVGTVSGHAKCDTVEDNQAATLRLMGISKPRISNSKPNGSTAPSGLFQGLLGMSRDEYVRKHIDYRLREDVKRLEDADLFELGQAHYSEQARQLQRLRKQRQNTHRSSAASSSTAPAPWPSTCASSSRQQRDAVGEEVAAAVDVDAWAEPPSATSAPDEWLTAPMGVAAPDGWRQASGTDVDSTSDTREATDNWEHDARVVEAATQSPQAAPAVTPQQAAPRRAVRGNSKAERVPGLTSWMEELRLSAHVEGARQWCEAMGAVSLEEVAQNVDDLADSLSGLRPLERRRLAKGAQALTEAVAPVPAPVVPRT